VSIVQRQESQWQTNTHIPVLLPVPNIMLASKSKYVLKCAGVIQRLVGDVKGVGRPDDVAWRKRVSESEAPPLVIKLVKLNG